jgi:hypothetical protein
VDPCAGHSEQYRPLSGYLALMGAFGGLAAAGLATAHRDGRLRDDIHAGDLALGAVATYKLSRLLSKDRVTSALRAPFTRFQDDNGHGEVEEAARGTGLRRAVGELLVCPNCVGLWVAGAFTAGFTAAPRGTRALASMLAIHAGADALQLVHGAADEKLG